jgi:putative flippase GtrA
MAMRENSMLQRWVRFNGVGALGVAVQLATLTWLLNSTSLHYLWATVIAVEAAVLHNFWWHERWTWDDRPAGSRERLLRRLVRFHLLNGVISLTGNLGVMRVLTGSAHVDPIAANIIAIIVCSLANFGASEWLVFRRAAVAAVLLMAVQPLGAATPEAVNSPTADMVAVDLRPQTIQAWDKYEQRVSGRYDQASASNMPFFALDAFQVKDWRSAAARGDVTMTRIERARPGDTEPDVSDGKIHHWTGAIFIPNTSLDTVMKRLADLAGQEQSHYQDVLASRLLSKEPDHYKIFMKIRRTKVITVSYNTEHDVHYRRISPTRASAKSVATRIAQLDEAGTPREREMKVGSDGGYLWRLNAYWRYEALNGGVMIECESVSLSRGIPFLLKPFVTSAVEGVARESLERTLFGLRKYLSAVG